MRISSGAMLSAIAISLGGCALLNDPLKGQSLDTDYAVGGGELQWGDKIIAAAKVFKYDDRVAVCGLWTVDNKQVLSIGMHDYFVETGIVRVGGENMVHNLTFMPEIDYSDNMSGEPTNCIVTTKSWRPEYDNAKVEVVFPRQNLGAGEMEDTKYFFRRSKQVEDITQ